MSLQRPSSGNRKIAMNDHAQPAVPCPLGEGNQCAQILREIGEINTRLDTFYRELLGNGQPGRIQRTEATVAKTLERLNVIEARAELDHGSNDLRDSVFKMSVSAVLGILVTVILGHFLHLIP